MIYLYIRIKSDGDLFNLRHLKANNKTQEQLVKELLFADDLALVTHSLQTMQDLQTNLCWNIKKIRTNNQHQENKIPNPKHP